MNSFEKIALAALGAAVGYAAFQWGGVLQSDQYQYLMVLGLIAIIVSLGRADGRFRAQRLPSVVGGVGLGGFRNRGDAGVLRGEDGGAKGREVRGPGGTDFALACAGALAAILVHSFADFNFYIPANAMLLAWIAGMTAGLRFQGSRMSDWERPAYPQVITVEVFEIASRR